MKYIFLVLIISASSFAGLKEIDTKIAKSINSYRLSKLKKVDRPLDHKEIQETKIKLSNLPTPYQKLPYYTWGLLKKNSNLKLISEEQEQKIKTIIEKYKEQKSRLHDERNYCRIRMLISSYKYAISKDESATLLKSQYDLWLEQWLMYKMDEDIISLQFTKECWKVFNKDQQKAIMNSDWKHVVKPLKD